MTSGAGASQTPRWGMPDERARRAKVMDAVTRGVSRERLVGYVTDHPGDDLADSEIFEVLAAAAALLRDRWLEPPSQACWNAQRVLRGERPLSHRDVERLREVARSQMDEALAARALPASNPGTATDDHGLALELAARLVRQEDVLAAAGGIAAQQESLFATLPSDERARVTDVCLYWRRAPALEAWLAKWERFIGFVEDDPGDYLYDEFENELYARDFLGEIERVLTPPSPDLLRRELEPLDARYRAATIALGHPIRAGTWDWRPGWWWHHVPRSAGEQFRALLAVQSPRAAEQLDDRQRELPGRT